MGQTNKMSQKNSTNYLIIPTQLTRAPAAPDG
ncbi:MAG: hypothetical protein ACI87X_001522, partial [Candidatus Arcticimaribacter sp.]